jgi:endonuclease YncB( thermonuclease family)
MGWGIAAVAMMLVTARCGSADTTAPTGNATQATSPSIAATPALQDTVQLTVQGVLDARTVLLSDGTEVRIDGLAAPEECWAAAATAFTKAFLLDKPVRVEHDDQSADGGSVLWLRDGTEYALLAVGQGVLRADAPHDRAFGDAEAAATRAGLGLWGKPCLGQPKGPVTTPPVTTTPPPPTTTPPPAPRYGCTVTYRVAKRWQGGFHTEVTIANTGNTAIVGWSLRWAFARGENISDAWNATVEQSGAQVKASELAASASIPAGGTQRFRFNASQGADSPVPKTFTLNDRPCTVKSP